MAPVTANKKNQHKKMDPIFLNLGLAFLPPNRIRDGVEVIRHRLQRRPRTSASNLSNKRPPSICSTSSRQTATSNALSLTSAATAFLPETRSIKEEGKAASIAASNAASNAASIAASNASSTTPDLCPWKMSVSKVLEWFDAWFVGLPEEPPGFPPSLWSVWEEQENRYGV